MGYFSEAGIFLIQVIFGFFILMVVLRLLFQWVRADFYNPVSQFVVKITNPALLPMRRFIPGWGGIDLSAVVLVLILQILEIVLVALISGATMHPGAIFVLAVTGLITLVLYVFIVAILIQVILSWVQPGSYNPMTALLYQLTSPILKPAQRLVPPISGLDLSPLVALIVLQLILLAVPHIRTELLRLFL